MSSTSPNVDGLHLIPAAAPAALVYKFVAMDASGAIEGRSAERFHVC
ncbi:MAG: hypothetical protein MUO38_09870 [Anaerolineales bacterium]|jgi:hypothetical protein|nr:hypothetical protein [Anaerolineales bacterium]